MKKNKQKIAVTLLLFLLCVISIGYAILQSSLDITGTTAIQDAKWDIHWNNVQITEGSVTGANVTTPATIDSSKTTVNYNIRLNKPGDFYEFTVDAVNAGTIDGMVASITSKLNGEIITTLPGYLQYYVKYADGIAIKENQLLAAGETETYVVRIEFKKDIDASQLPGEEKTLNLSFTVAYNQADSNAEEIRDYVYRSNENNVAIGDPSSGLGTTYTSYEVLSSVTGSTVFLRHKIKNGLVDTAEVGFVYGGNVYYLTGGINESGEEAKPIFESNVNTINGAGIATCSTASNRCIFSNSGTAGQVYNTGQVYLSSNGLRCDITTAGESYCH